MNTKMSLALAALVVAPSMANAQGEGYSHPITVSLTETVQGDATVTNSASSKTSNGVTTEIDTTSGSNKLVTTKIGNTQVLEQLLDLGAFDGAATPVRSIKGFTLNLFLNAQGVPVGVFAVNGAAVFNVTDFIDLNLGDLVESGSNKQVVTTITGGAAPGETTVSSASFKQLGVAGLAIVEPADDPADVVVLAQADGTYTASGKFAQDTSKPDSAGAISTDDGLTTISSISGSGWSGSVVDEDDEVSIFQGSVKIGAGKKITLPAIP